MTVAVTHNTARHRFEATVEGQLCVADYQLRGTVMWMTHTGVPSVVGGRGIAAELVRVALKWAEVKGYTVEPSCSYVEVYMRRHPETQKLLAR
jgi:predicted GNAT family acetyltransferase